MFLSTSMTIIIKNLHEQIISTHLGHDFAKRCVISIILLIVDYGYMKVDLTNESKVFITFSRTLKNILQTFEW
jgi:hypothetical protein